MTVGELTGRGCYLGSNVSYNVKKMVENRYLEQERSPHDRRSIRLRLSPKGLELYEKMDSLHEAHVAKLLFGSLGSDTLSGMNDALQALERFWSDEIRFGGVR